MADLVHAACVLLAGLGIGFGIGIAAAAYSLRNVTLTPDEPIAFK